jgi:hypothetical protein
MAVLAEALVFLGKELTVLLAVVEDLEALTEMSA